jgi:hypothetical protein
MRRLFTALTNALPLHANARRALDQTLKDWTHEEAVATTPTRRWLARLMALVAVARVLTLIAIAEAQRACVSSIAVRVVVVFAALLSLDAGWLGAHVYQSPYTYGVPNLWLGVFVSQSFPALITLALFLATSRFRRAVPPVPVLGLGLLSLIVMMVAAGWVAPVATEHFQVAAFREIGSRGWPPSRSFEAFTFPELIRALGDVDVLRPFSLLSQISLRVSVILLGPALLLFAGVVSRTSRPSFWIWTLPVSGLYVWLFVLGHVQGWHLIIVNVFMPLALPSAIVLTAMALSLRQAPPSVHANSA